MRGVFFCDIYISCVANIILSLDPSISLYVQESRPELRGEGDQYIYRNWWGEPIKVGLFQQEYSVNSSSSVNTKLHMIFSAHRPKIIVLRA